MNKKLLSLVKKESKLKEITVPTVVVIKKEDETILRVRIGRTSIPLDRILGTTTTRAVVHPGDEKEAVELLQASLDKGELDPAIAWTRNKISVMKNLQDKRNALKHI
jgi:hypothetical protein